MHVDSAEIVADEVLTTFGYFMPLGLLLANFYRSFVTPLRTCPPLRTNIASMPVLSPDAIQSRSGDKGARDGVGACKFASSFSSHLTHPAQAMEVQLTDAPAGGFTFDNVQRYVP